MTESKIQQGCVNWYRYQYPQYRRFLISVPNGGRRDGRTGAMIKKEGGMAGAPDLILFDPYGKLLPLLLECKKPQEKQSPTQVLFQQDYERVGYSYLIFRSLDEFMAIVNPYLVK